MDTDIGTYPRSLYTMRIPTNLAMHGGKWGDKTDWFYPRKPLALAARVALY